MAAPEPPEELSAPFFLLTYGDLMTLLMVFFILLFSMSTITEIKFQAQIGVMKGALGISQQFASAPMQKSLPKPSVSQSPRVIARSSVKPSTLRPLAEYKRIDLTEPVQHEESEKIKQITTFGREGDVEINVMQDEVILVLPSYGVFEKGSYKINPDSIDVQRVISFYEELGSQIAGLSNYDIYFVGHTDSLSLIPVPGGPGNNTELGFLRAMSMYNFFFSQALKDKTRITFSSQGDNVPVVPNASLDSERRKNRRVQIHLKKINR
jgi:chemotaxis protein MotB